MPTMDSNGTSPDPEVLVMVFLLGGALAALSFIVVEHATRIGTQIESPAPIQGLRNVFEQTDSAVMQNLPRPPQRI